MIGNTILSLGKDGFRKAKEGIRKVMIRQGDNSYAKAIYADRIAKQSEVQQSSCLNSILGSEFSP